MKQDNLAQNLNYLASRIVQAEYSKIPNSEFDQWLAKVTECSELIECFLTTMSTTIPDEEKQTFRSFWERVSILRYYNDRLVKPKLTPPKFSFFLWNTFKETVDMKSFKSFEDILKFMDTLDKMIKKDSLERADKCPGCNRYDFDQLFKVSSCKSCKICANCTKESASTGKCASCQHKLASDNKFTKTNDINQHNQRLKQFKVGLNSFFMDIVQNLCFDRSFQCLPHSDVIDSIIKHLLPRTVHKSAEEQSLDLSLSPSIKSTLFQLLLNYCQSSVTSHLEKIFSQSANYLNGQYKSDDLTNLKIMYVNSIEDSLHSRYEENLREKLLKLVEDINESTTVNSEVDKLEMVARIRFSLVSFVRLVTAHGQDALSKDVQVLNERVRDMVEMSSSCLWLKFFIIKDVFRRHGQNEFKNLIRNDHFKWILPDNLTVRDDEVIKTKINQYYCVDFKDYFKYCFVFFRTRLTFSWFVETNIEV